MPPPITMRSGQSLVGRWISKASSPLAVMPVTVQPAAR